MWWKTKILEFFFLTKQEWISCFLWLWVCPFISFSYMFLSFSCIHLSISQTYTRPHRFPHYRFPHFYSLFPDLFYIEQECPRTKVWRPKTVTFDLAGGFAYKSTLFRPSAKCASWLFWVLLPFVGKKWAQWVLGCI